MSIENRLHSFLYSKESGAIVLQGKWGQGKTFFWRKKVAAPFLADNRLSWRSKKYSYVSLFGVDSLADLKVAIFQASEESDVNGRSIWRRFVSFRWWWFLIRRAVSILLDSGDIPYTAALSKTYTALTFYSIRDRLICLDDIERRGKGLALKDVMGLISQLVEQRSCRVVVILNTGALNADQSVWDDNKEKVFIGELTFNPDSSECVDLVLDDVKHMRWAAIARARLISLGLTNIRVIQRARRFIEVALSAAGDKVLLEETVDQIVSVLVMLVYSHSGQGEGAPPMEMVMRSSGISQAVIDALEKKDSDESKQVKKWKDLLSSYGLYFGDELDIALRDFVLAGYPDEDMLRGVIEKFEVTAQQYREKQAWHDAWKLYHDHLNENQEALINAFAQTWPPVSHRESANNLQWLARLLRVMGRPDMATDFIQTWVNQRKRDRSEELTPRKYNMFDKIDDEELLTAINEGYVQNLAIPDLAASLSLMSETHGNDDGALRAWANATPDELVALLDGNPGPVLHDAIKRALGAPHMSNLQEAAKTEENIRQALAKIARRSDLSAHRIRHKFGLDREGNSEE